MRKSIVITVLALFLIAPLLIATPALASFTANGPITITGVTGAGAVDMTIRNLSASDSWEFSSGVFTVTNPSGTTFTVSCNNSDAKAIQVTLSGSIVACVKNSNPGTNYVTLPSDTGIYTVSPNTANHSNSASYNSSCGVATCNAGYTVSGSGADARCIVPNSPAPPGGGTSSTTETPADEEPTTTEETPVAEEPTATEEPVSTTAGVPATDSAGKVTLGQMTTDAETVASGDVNQVIAEMGVSRDLAAEANNNETIVAKIVVDSGITAQVRNTITNFVTYGTKATKVLGAGERAGVVNSFQAAFGKLPANSADWNDVIKIANGRWPSQTNVDAESRATVNFKKIYLREPDRSNAHDDAAVTVMTYGLRPADRNLNSEKAGIRIFKNIYGYNPEKATAWDVVRAIAYSGAIR